MFRLKSEGVCFEGGVRVGADAYAGDGDNGNEDEDKDEPERDLGDGDGGGVGTCDRRGGKGVGNVRTTEHYFTSIGTGMQR